jgi:probable phosphoglycerate mutase
MDILFARHGNTFNPGDKVVWVGRETDLPLVDKGLQQAVRAAEALRAAGLVPDAVYAASLSRTRRFAAIVCETLGLPAATIDPRLDEVDYGDWAGRSNDEIAAAGPATVAAMEAWNSRDVWPEGMGWKSRSADVLAAIRQFADEILAEGRHARPLVVSSNGILRFLPRILLDDSVARDSFKMRTGHLGRIVRRQGQVTLACWDSAPEQLAGDLSM